MKESSVVITILIGQFQCRRIGIAFCPA